MRQGPNQHRHIRVGGKGRDQLRMQLFELFGARAMVMTGEVDEPQVARTDDRDRRSAVDRPPAQALRFSGQVPAPPRVTPASTPRGNDLLCAARARRVIE